jgi:hypothetical protein
MAIECNIDACGRAVRLIYALLLVLAGTLLAVFWACGAQSVLAWVVSVGLVLGGAFAVFEAGAGWCVLRAMGWRTRI